MAYTTSTAPFSIAIPNNPSLVGVAFFNQGATLPIASYSNSGEARIGQ